MSCRYKEVLDRLEGFVLQESDSCRCTAVVSELEAAQCAARTREARVILAELRRLKGEAERGS